MLNILIGTDFENNYIFTSLIGKEYQIEKPDELTTWDTVEFYEWGKEKSILKMALKKDKKLVKAISLSTIRDFDKVMEYKYGIRFVVIENTNSSIFIEKSKKDLTEIRNGLSLFINKGYTTIEDIQENEKNAFLVLFQIDLSKLSEDTLILDLVKDTYI